MNIIFKLDSDYYINIPNIHRYEGAKKLTVFSFQWYDSKGKKEDIRETIFCFDNNRLYCYKDNDALEEKIRDCLLGKISTDTLDLTDFEFWSDRFSFPKSFKLVKRIA